MSTIDLDTLAADYNALRREVERLTAVGEELTRQRALEEVRRVRAEAEATRMRGALEHIAEVRSVTYTDQTAAVAVLAKEMSRLKGVAWDALR